MRRMVSRSGSGRQSTRFQANQGRQWTTMQGGSWKEEETRPRSTSPRGEFIHRGSRHRSVLKARPPYHRMMGAVVQPHEAALKLFSSSDGATTSFTLAGSARPRVTYVCDHDDGQCTP